MAASKKLAVTLSPIAIGELEEIWRWNLERYGPAHADAYAAFLKTRIDRLQDSYLQGDMVLNRPDLRYIIARRRSGGHGHVIVYMVDEWRVNVAHVFHTAQDWQARFAAENSGPDDD